MIAIMTYYRLNNHTHYWCGKPKPGELLDFGAIISEYATGITVLKREAHLNAHEPKAHVPDLPKGHEGFPGK